MITTKQRAQLRKMANTISDTLHVGKDGVTEAVERQLDELLDAHELVKGKVLESALLTAKTVAASLAESNGCEVVQCIGNKFVLYRPSRVAEKRKIVLVK